jgi:CubicO group peptidase (beta-lactamase class C family)
LHIAGLSLAIVESGNVVKAQGYGLANVEHGVPAKPETVYEIASLTKAFTACAILVLTQEERISLDGPIATYLEGLPDAWRGVTVRQLLNHTSGIPNYQEAAGYSILANYTRADLIALAATLPARSAPGEAWSYTNTGYVLLGGIIEKAAREPYGTYLDERILRPAGMSSTRLNDHRSTIPHRASGYAWQGGTWVNVPRQTIVTSAGGLISTVLDLAKWDAALRSDRILRPETVAHAWLPGTLGDGTRSSYGFGWFTTTIARRRVVEHTGNTPGFSAAILRYLDGETTVIVLSNAEEKSLKGFARRIARTWIERPTVR